MDDINRSPDQTESIDSSPDVPPRSRSCWGTLEGRVISLVSRKGGVGKTTSAVNLGAALALSGHTVLVVGMDPQCGVCRTLGTAPEELKARLTDIFHSDTNLLEVAHTSPLDGLQFVSPGITSLQDEEEYLELVAARPDDFISAVDHARNFYDTVLIDCPPSLGPVTRTALLASDSYLVPVQAEELCRESLDTLLDFVDDFRDRHYGDETGFLDLPPVPEHAPDLPRPIELEGLFLTMVNERTRMGQHVTERVRKDFGAHLLGCAVPRTTRLSEMALRGKPAVIYDRRSKGSRIYFDLADELVERYRLKSGDQPVTPAADETPATVAREEVRPEDAAMEAGAAEETRGLSGFLAALGGAAAVADRIPAFDEPQAPEMVSLDELLAEEEAGQDNGNDDWDEEIWPHRPHRLN